MLQPSSSNTGCNGSAADAAKAATSSGSSCPAVGWRLAKRNPVRRVWCIYEVFWTLQAGRALIIKSGTSWNDDDCDPGTGESPTSMTTRRDVAQIA